MKGYPATTIPDSEWKMYSSFWDVVKPQEGFSSIPIIDPSQELKTRLQELRFGETKKVRAT